MRRFFERLAMRAAVRLAKVSLRLAESAARMREEPEREPRRDRQPPSLPN